MRKFLVFLSLFFSFRVLSQAIVSSPLSEISPENFQFKILFLNETSRIPFVNFNLENSLLIRRSHSRTIRGYELSFLLKRTNPKYPVLVKDIYWIKDGKRYVMGTLRSSSVPNYPPQRNNSVPKSMSSEDIKILTEVSTDKYFYGKGVVIKYSLISKSNYLDYKITKFPKFDGYIKRFREVPSRSKRVLIDGEYWNQSDLYLVELFALVGQKQKVHPLVVEVKRYSQKIELTSENFSPKFSSLDSRGALFGENNLTLYPEEGSSYEANKPVSIIVEVSGKGLLENHEPKLSKNLRPYLVDQSIENQAYNIPDAKKVFNYRFIFPKDGTYEGFFEITLVENETLDKKIIKRSFAFDILPPIIERKFNGTGNKVLLKVNKINSKDFIWFLVGVLFFVLNYRFVRREYLILQRSIRLRRKLIGSDRIYEEIFKIFYNQSNTKNYDLVEDMSARFFKDDKIKSIVEILRGIKSKSTLAGDISFRKVYALVRRLH